MDIKVGEYVISKNRLVIGKIIDIENDDKILIKTRKVEIYVGKWNIKRHSFELIDLIEELDYVNGIKVIGIGTMYNYESRKYEKFLDMISDAGTGVENTIFNNHIENIVTKEVFENNCYRVGE